MFDIGASELLVIVVVAILVIGPKDMPLALRTAGRWLGKIRRVSTHFRTGLDAMIREAEMEDMEKKWKAQNEAIMKASSGTEMEPINAETMAPPGAVAPNVAGASAESRVPKADEPPAGDPSPSPPSSPSPPPPPSPGAADEPELPLGKQAG